MGMKVLHGNELAKFLGCPSPCLLKRCFQRIMKLGQHMIQTYSKPYRAYKEKLWLSGKLHHESVKGQHKNACTQKDSNSSYLLSKQIALKLFAFVFMFYRTSSPRVSWSLISTSFHPLNFIFAVSKVRCVAVTLSAGDVKEVHVFLKSLQYLNIKERKGGCMLTNGNCGCQLRFQPLQHATLPCVKREIWGLIKVVFSSLIQQYPLRTKC